MSEFRKDRGAPRVLVTGATGTLGRQLVEQLEQITECVSLGYQNKTKGGCNVDLTETKKTINILNDLMPDIIIHAAALTDVDGCEREPCNAYRINVLATKNIVDWVKLNDLQTRVIYISTDHVYNSDGYSMENQVDPVNYYAYSKLWAEEIIRRLENHLILRTNFFGIDNINNRGIVNWLIDASLKNKPIILFEDIYFNPVYISYLVDIIIRLLAGKSIGTYNVGSSGSGLSKADFVESIADVYALQTKSFKRGSINDISTLIAKRPQDMRMNTESIETLLKTKTPTIAEGIKKMIEENKDIMNMVSSLNHNSITK